MYQRLVETFYKKQNNKRALILILILSLFVLFISGCLIGYRVHGTKKKNIINEYYDTLIEDKSNDKNLRKTLLSQINTENLKTHLKYLSSIPHLAGSDGGNQAANYVYNYWKDIGLDSVHMIDYDVYLDFPHESKFNSIEIKNLMNDTLIKYEIKEAIYDPELDFGKISKPFLAYSPSGSITTDKLYYANYCERKDFEFILSKNLSLNDSIVLCRYGWSFRANKIYNAQFYGVKGVLIFDDPSRSAPKQVQDQIYPNGQFMPKDGTQRGTLNIKDGDPLTPLYPSNKYSHRINENDAEVPKILSQVIGYGLAQELLNLMDDTYIPDEAWKGELNASYSIGGLLKSKQKIGLNVFNVKRTEKIQNVIGVLKGSVEPDRYVMVGNHRDAWTFGSVDPSSATSVLLEVSRSLNELRSNLNWSPKRSIIFLSWDAEEYGLIGSTEWVEEFMNKIIANGVVYINCDNAVQGTFSYEAKASPQLHKILFDVTQNIQYNNDLTVYDRWIENDPSEDRTKPRVNSNMGSGSDHANFLQRAGIPCIDQKFVRNRKDSKFKNIVGSYPLYHTSYETFKLVEKYVDPEFFGMSTLTKVISETTRVLADSLLLPFDIENYSIELRNQFSKFNQSYSSKLNNWNVSLNDLEESIDNFGKNVKEFNQRLEKIDKTKYHLIRQFNDQMKNLERSFLDAHYIDTGSMHTLYAPSSFNKYLGNSFPGVTETIEKLQEAKNDFPKLIDDLKLNLGILVNSIQSASHILKDPTDFNRF